MATSERTPPKPQLHQSHLAMLWRCGIQFENRYVKGIVKPPGIANLVGTAVHRAASKNLQHKAERKTLLPIESVRTEARDAFMKAFHDEGLRLTEEERREGLKAVKGKAIDRAVSLATVYSTEIAPKRRPAKQGVGFKFVIAVKGSSHDFAGEMDDLEQDTSIRDVKTWVANRGQAEADRSEQLSFYALAHKVRFGVLPKSVGFDALVDYKAGPKAIPLTSQRDMQDIAVSLARFQKSVEIIEKGAFTPASQSDWWCSKRYCGYAETCPYFRGRETVAVNGNGKGVSHGQ
mgnify:CR=1 FL=1